MITKHTGEFHLPTDSDSKEIAVNVQRYLFAMNYCKDKKVLDASCGSGLGTYFYSLIAKKVIAVDNNKSAIEYAKQYPFQKRKVQFINADLEKDLLPEHDICISIETIEHLENPDFFLSQLKGKELVFSIPLNSLAISSFHKYDFKDIDDIKEIVNRYYKIEEYLIQDNKWIYGHGIKT